MAVPDKCGVPLWDDPNMRPLKDPNEFFQGRCMCMPA